MVMHYLVKYKILYHYIMDVSCNSIFNDMELQKTIEIVTTNLITKRKCSVILPIPRTPRNN
jgi:hypothetical protein